MTMKRILNRLFFATLLLSAIGIGTDRSIAETEQVKAPPPNIIFILTDDQGYGDLGRHGHPLLKTPHTDRLYDESVRFDNFYVSPSCSPSRAALMTGMHEFRNGVTHTILPREHLWKDAVILPHLFRSGDDVHRRGGRRSVFLLPGHLLAPHAAVGTREVHRALPW
jgi:hypothetical protein